jgi:hypothetical protein
MGKYDNLSYDFHRQPFQWLIFIEPLRDTMNQDFTEYVQSELEVKFWKDSLTD